MVKNVNKRQQSDEGSLSFSGVQRASMSRGILVSIVRTKMG